MNKILIVEDDIIIGEMLHLYLHEEDYKVVLVASATEGLAALGSFHPDMILLDLLLPDTEHMDVCSTFRRKTKTGIIVISSKSDVSERIQALAAGADDYLCKPFSMHELKARIEAVLRRTNSVSSAPLNEASEVNPSGAEIEMNAKSRQLFAQGKLVELTYSEFELMSLFFQHPGVVFTRDELINALHGIDAFINDRAIDVHIRNLRRKLEKDPKEPKYIKTVRNVGYKFEK